MLIKQVKTIRVLNIIHIPKEITLIVLMFKIHLKLLQEYLIKVDLVIIIKRDLNLLKKYIIKNYLLVMINLYIIVMYMKSNQINLLLLNNLMR